MKLSLHVGNIFELAGGSLGVWAAWRYFGPSGAVVAAAVLCVAAAELLYDDVVLHVPLPRLVRWSRRAVRSVRGLVARWSRR